MRLALACLALFVAIATSQTCDGILTCLKLGETDCNYFGLHDCEGGSYCRVPNSGGQQSAETLRTIGTCTVNPRLSADCYDELNEELVVCFDPTHNGIFCVDPDSDNNATCLYFRVAQPGETCFAGDATFYNGGCAPGIDCVQSRCERPVALNEACDGDDDCGVDRFCERIPLSDDLCKPRLGENMNCTFSRQCDPLFVCSNLGIRPYRQCIKPWTRKEAQTCNDNYDCEAGLFCNGAVCRKPSSYKKDYCTGGDCQAGWECECHSQVKGDKLVEIGGKCTINLANQQDDIDKYNKYQQCAKDLTCGDKWYYENDDDDFAPSVRTAPGTCTDECWRRAGYKYDNAEGKCFSSAGALLPTFVVLVAALVVVLAN